MSAVERLHRFKARVKLDDPLETRRKRRFRRMMRAAEKGQHDDAEKQRVWMEAVMSRHPGRVLNICCGDFPLDDAVGVDMDPDVFGLDYRVPGDDLAFCEDDSVDCIVTNYIEVFSDAYKLFEEWHRVLKRGGGVAITCIDAEQYDPLKNTKKFNCFTGRTLTLFLQKSGFVVDSVETSENTLFVVAHKPRRRK